MAGERTFSASVPSGHDALFTPHDDFSAFAVVLREVGRQDEIHPTGFIADRDGIRLALAAMQDELDESLEAFQRGDVRVLVTKPSIAGWGLNFQQCARVAFCGLSDSFEAYYQAVRRSWRYGQKREVHVHRVTSLAERPVRSNIDRKREEYERMMDAFVDARGRLRSGRDDAEEVAYDPGKPIELPAWLAEPVAA